MNKFEIITEGHSSENIQTIMASSDSEDIKTDKIIFRILARIAAAELKGDYRFRSQIIRRANEMMSNWEAFVTDMLYEANYFS